ncbi:chromogranin-A [Gouania willdenowi]|uniref:Chromogranin A n=1 Tax=Gouania willdenowi TaxID=441366 RepID=A0A8C5NCN5_GOUWI|nr:chromogranin-A [Gouania willdenowi]
MAQRGLLVLLTALFSCVLSLPVTSSQLENEDVKVMKCIVEVLADVLSRSHVIPVSQECLSTLKTDDRLVTILRHRNFLKELQEIAVQGGQERAQLQGDARLPSLTTQTLQTANDVADQSMLEALGGPGDKSILFQKKMTDNEGGAYEKMNDIVEDEEKDEFEGAQVKKEHDEKPRSHISESVRRREKEEDGSDERRVKEENVNEDKRGVESGEKREPRTSKTKEKKSNQEHEEEKDRRSALISHQHERRHEEAKREHEENLKRWAKSPKSPSLRKKAVGSRIQEVSEQQEVPHHSKEVAEETEEEKREARRSPEEQELQMIAHKTPEEKRGSEEEGSASRKSEEPEIESLAAIESELENVAQKLHGLRHG